MAYVARKPDDDQFRSASQNLQAQNRAQQGQVEKRQDSGGTAPAGAESASNKAPGDFTKSNFSNATDILDRNKNADISSVTKRLLGNTEKNAQGENQRIADQVNQYKNDTTNTVNSLYKAPGQEDIDKALGGDANSESAITKRLGMAAGKVGDLDLGNRYEIAPTEFYKQNEYQPLLQQRSKNGYTSGMAALDSSLFNRSGGAQDIRNTVGRLQSGIDESRAQAPKVTQELQDYANTYEGQQEDYLRNLLSGSGAKIKDEISSRLPSAQQSMKDTIESQRSNLTGQQQSSVQKAIDDFNKQVETARKLGIDPKFLEQQSANQMRNFNSLDPNSYLKNNLPELGFNDLVTQSDADKYNKLSGWLGTGDTLAAPAQQKQAGVEFNEKAFNDWLSGVSGGNERQIIDANIQKQLDLRRAQELKDALAKGDSNKAIGAATGGNQGTTGGTKKSSGGGGGGGVIGKLKKLIGL